MSLPRMCWEMILMSRDSYESLQTLIYQTVIEKMDFNKDLSDREIFELIDDVIVSESKRRTIEITDRGKLKEEVYHAIRKLDVLQQFIDDPDITEIMVNGKDRIFIEKNGILTKTDSFLLTDEKLNNLILQIVSKCNRRVNESSPIVDARLEDGSRVNVVMSPISIDGSAITIRKFPKNPITMETLIRLESISEEAVNFLKTLIVAGYNIFISGGTGSGKTTFLNALSAFIPQEERIITIEDSAELQLLGLPNLVRLETRNQNAEGCMQISIRDLIKTSLRMRPDRIVVGEVRGEEAVDLLQCLNTGHDGSMSTGHANSAPDMLSRLETMVLMGMDLPIGAVRRQIASGIDILVHLGRLRDKSRKVLQIVEIVDYKDGEIRLNTLFEYEETGENEEGKVVGTLQKKAELTHKEKLLAAGFHV